jgi:hypothetical protein
MAITGTDRGAAAISTNATTGTFSPASNFAAGSWAVCCIGLNNSNTNGIAYSIFTVTDSLGNTWTKRISPLNDPALANAGVEAAIFTTSMDGGTLTTGTTITITTNVATVARVVTLMEVIPTGGSTIGYVTGASSTATSATPSIITGSITSGNMVVAAFFVEFGSDLIITQDADTTNGSWSAQQSTTVGGSLLTGLSMASQRKVVTATATQTYNPTLSSSEDLCIGWIELNETAVGNRRRRLLIG